MSSSAVSQRWQAGVEYRISVPGDLDIRELHWYLHKPRKIQDAGYRIQGVQVTADRYGKNHGFPAWYSKIK
jgi:hypothetical protein